MLLLTDAPTYRQWFYSLTQTVPRLAVGVLLFIATLVLAYFTKKWSIRLFNRFELSKHLVDWQLAADQPEASRMVDTLGSILYFIVLVLFMPNLLDRLNIGGVLTPVVNMFNQFLLFIPQLITAVAIFVLGLYFCRFVRTLVRNLLISLKVDAWVRKLSRDSWQTSNADDFPAGHQIAEGLASVVYILIFIPIFIVSLETLAIPSVAKPIIEILDAVMQAVPHVFVAVVLMIVGNYFARLVGDVIERLLQTSGVDRFSDYLNFKGRSSMQLSQITGNIVRSVIWLFFIVEALNSLQLEVLMQIGNAVIDYLPLVLSSLIILGSGLIGGNLLARFLYHVSSSRIFSEFARYGTLVLAIFMTLEQLKFAPTIVYTGFIIVLSAFAIAFGVAFAIAFGLGGRDFAAKQLNKLDQAIQDRQTEDAPANAEEDIENKK